MAIDTKLAKQRLEDKRNALEEELRISAEARKPVELDQQAVGRLSRMDAMQAQEMAKEAERRRKLELTRIEMAERRLREDEYGYCNICGEEIPDGRLKINPMAEKCVGCA